MERIQQLNEENRQSTLVLLQLQIKILSLKIAQDKIRMQMNERDMEIEEIQAERLDE